MHNYPVKKLLIRWYENNKRDLPWRNKLQNKRYDPYLVLVSEIMLQQTTVPTVARRYLEFINKWPTVRDLSNEKKVTGITYDSHDALVIKSFEEIYQESQDKFKFENSAVFIEHVKGHVKLGETSIIIAVACKHRAQAYDLSRFIIEEIKKRTPIWKKEHYENKDSEWLKGNPIKHS